MTVGICDVTPGWHAPTGRLLGIGHTVRYKNNKLMGDPRPRETAYTVYDPATGQWTPWQVLEMPDPDKFFSAGAGCAQWLVENGGTILLPIYFKNRSTDCYTVSVFRCRFDGEELTCVEQGGELVLDVPRGYCEPSLTRFRGRYYLTLRNDVKGYVAVGGDG